jgi:hypothetical protein
MERMESGGKGKSFTVFSPKKFYRKTDGTIRTIAVAIFT